MDSGQRLSLIALELVALGVVVALVSEPGPRVALGVIIGALIARTAWVARDVAEEGPPEGLPERRGDHLFRHWTNVLVKKIREFHTVCQAIREERVSPAAGEMRVEEIERELQELVIEVADLAKPPRLRRKRSRPSGEASGGGRDRPYGEPASSD